LLTLLVPVSLDVPVGVRVTGVVLLRAGNFDLLETPLRQVLVTSTEVAAKSLVLKTESSSKGSDSAAIARCGVTHNLNLPVILVVANSNVAVARNLLIRLGHRGGNIVGVKVTAGLGVDETDG
jgi:hypothetical protein